MTDEMMSLRGLLEKNPFPEIDPFATLPSDPDLETGAQASLVYCRHISVTPHSCIPEYSVGGSYACARARPIPSLAAPPPGRLRHHRRAPVALEVTLWQQ